MGGFCQINSKFRKQKPCVNLILVSCTKQTQIHTGVGSGDYWKPSRNVEIDTENVGPGHKEEVNPKEDSNASRKSSNDSIENGTDEKDSIENSKNSSENDSTKDENDSKGESEGEPEEVPEEDGGTNDATNQLIPHVWFFVSILSSFHNPINFRWIDILFNPIRF